jgi:acetolactate synthase-1/2/3 large subunit
VHELATCRRLRLGVKVLVINNQWLGMVRQWQDMIYDGRRVESDLGHEAATPYPDFVRVAEGYRIRAERVSRPDQLYGAMHRFIEDPDEPFLLDVMVEREHNVYPMIPAGKTYQDVMLSDADLPSSVIGDT